MFRQLHATRFYSEYDTKGIVDFLNKMATKGWLLVKKAVFITDL